MKTNNSQLYTQGLKGGFRKIKEAIKTTVERLGRSQAKPQPALQPLRSRHLNWPTR